jgi:hypothetical protein
MKLNKFHRENLEKMVSSSGADIQTIDIEAYWDSKLTAEENYNRVRQFLSLNPEKIYQKDEVEDYEQQAAELERMNIQEEVKKEFKEILSKETSDLKIYYFILEKYLTTILKARHIHSLFITGKAGIGKSHTTVKTISNSDSDFKCVLGNISPLELYHTLYNYRKGVLIFDDTQGLLANKPSMSLLMSAMWNPTNRRMVCWLTTSKKLKAPPQFEFLGKIIFIANEIPDNIKPIVSRCFEYRLDFNYYEILKIMAEISKLPHPTLKKEEKQMIVDWIKENTDETTENFDLRLQKKIETLYEYNKKEWKELSLKLVCKDKDLAVIKQLMESKKTVKQMVKDFEEQTGKGRRMFFYKKRLISIR